ncbi:predicted protein [Nematostella vectensis]|uniref:Peptidase S49 domain-containing protein n=2 Tax=Nematostella vectensis TaxID=45351 RepID=A7SVI5_NEMVE|nr:predicted protein [Nematostella vectensis]|eukprot:XP_001624386.1 predicted protein [Nematostella vectensis]
MSSLKKRLCSRFSKGNLYSKVESNIKEEPKKMQKEVDTFNVVESTGEESSSKTVCEFRAELFDSTIEKNDLFKKESKSINSPEDDEDRGAARTQKRSSASLDKVLKILRPRRRDAICEEMERGIRNKDMTLRQYRKYLATNSILMELKMIYTSAIRPSANLDELGIMSRSWVPWRTHKNVVRIIRLQGIINASSSNHRALSLRRVEKAIDRAFEVKKVAPKAVCLEINSTGGSPVQSNLIYTRIREQANDKKIPVLSFVEDHALSGGYWLSLAGDEIFVDPNSAVGSIGAVSSNVGVVEAMKKLGLEYRPVVMGEHKVRMNPMEPLKPEDVEWVKKILAEVHNNFIDLVKERRTKLDTTSKTVFSGDIFLGKEAVRIGLVDAITTDLKSLCKKRFGEDVVFERCDLPQDFFTRMMNKRFGMEASINVDEALDSLAIRGQREKIGF